MKQNPNADKKARKIVSVILAAGRGTRMQSPDTHKVCFPIEGRPAIARAVETYRRCGISSNFIVVGQLAEQVMQSIASTPGDLFFCYQPEQRGTGNAAKAAAKLLKAMDYSDDVLIVAGDKVIEDSIMQELIDTFYKTGSDMAFVVGDVADFPSSGRIVYGEDEDVKGIVEVFDIARTQLLLMLRRITSERLVTAQEAESLILAHLKQEKKAAVALGPLWEAVKAGHAVTKTMISENFTDSDFTIRVNDTVFTPEILTNIRHANLSVYLIKAPVLYDALDQLTSDNAQQEEYITDIVGILSSGNCRLRTVPVSYPQQVMAFNTPAELKAIEDYTASRRRITVTETPRATRPVGEWLAGLESVSPESTRYFNRIYQPGSPLIENKRRMLVSMLKGYLKEFGSDEVAIARAPGRVNIMGRHIDHQGGHVNMIGIDRDIYLAIGARSDRQVHLRNQDPHQFPDRHFDMDDLMDGRRSSWLDYMNSESVRERVYTSRGDWSDYIKAASARFQSRFSHRTLKGMNIFAAGDIPVASGLSSSSAIVVAAAEAIVRLNDIDVSPQQFVELCGEAEWYVGTRGGAGDHSAMKFARKGYAVQMGFFPFGVSDQVQFPTGYLFVVCDSQEKARKTAGARDVFNHRIACYHIGRELLKQRFPRYSEAIEHLRDFNTRNLGASYPELLNMLKQLPVSMTRKEVSEQLPPDITNACLGLHSESLDSYPIRSVVVFGLAEAERSKACVDLLRRDRVSEFGRWMNISHNGDRVVTWDRMGNCWPFTVDYSDRALDQLAEQAEKSPEEAALVRQPGGYTCSIPQIDRMVDLALSVKGVMGAQILGAGLGGCMLALVDGDSYSDLERTMIRHYYDPADLEPGIFACYPVEGSGLVIY